MSLIVANCPLYLPSYAELRTRSSGKGMENIVVFVEATKDYQGQVPRGKAKAQYSRRILIHISRTTNV